MSITARVYVCSEPPKVEEPEEWKEQQLSTVELYIQTHNKNPVEMVSLKTAVSQSLHVLLLNLHPLTSSVLFVCPSSASTTP